MSIAAIHYREGVKYWLARDYSVQTPFRPVAGIVSRWITLTDDGILTIEDGYAWDGPSGPTQDTPDTMRAALVHDALYDLIRHGYLPKSARHIADDLFKAILTEDGVDEGRVALWYAAVRQFGEAHASPDSAPPVLVAPRDYMRVDRQSGYRD